MDPRVRRTRRMLEQALEDLLKTTPLGSISVADITEAATLNRATFYGHFNDKFDLLAGMVASRFEELLAARQLAFDGTCPSALKGITLAVCDYLAALPYCPEKRQMEQHLESALIDILRRMISNGLQKHPPRSDLAPGIIASALAGGIYHAARQWIRDPDRLESENVAASIAALLTPIMLGAA